jgi:hypothetical protein
MRVMTAGGTALVTLLAAGVVGAAPKTMKCQMTTVTDAQGMHVNVQARIWVKGEKARVESDNPETGPILVLVDGPKVRTLFPQQKRGMVRNDGPPSPWEVAIANVTQLTKGAKKLGRQNLEGHPCDIYERRAPDGSMTLKAWITTDTQPRVPLRIEQKVQVRRPNVTIDRTQTTRITGLQFGAPIPDSLFAVPPGYKIVQAGAPGAPGMPGPGRPGMGP